MKKKTSSSAAAAKKPPRSVAEIALALKHAELHPVRAVDAARPGAAELLELWEEEITAGKVVGANGQPVTAGTANAGDEPGTWSKPKGR